jgi:hypothetical protein
MAQAIDAGRDHRCNGKLALHVIEVLTGILEAGETGQRIEMQTTCDRPEALAPDQAAALLQTT